MAELEIAGQRVRLRPFTASNITPAYLAWLRDPQLMRYSNQRFRSHTIETSRSYLRSFEGTDNLFLAIYRNEEMVGTMTAYRAPMHGTADMGILVGAGNQGQGLGADAWSTLMGHLLAAGTRKVTAGTLRCNSAMVKIMVGSRMVPDGVRVAQELVDGRPEDLLYYAKFASS